MDKVKTVFWATLPFLLAYIAIKVYEGWQAKRSAQAMVNAASAAPVASPDEQAA